MSKILIKNIKGLVQYGEEMPIVAAVCSVLFEQVEPAQAVAALLARDPRPESGR